MKGILEQQLLKKVLDSEKRLADDLKFREFIDAAVQRNKQLREQIAIRKKQEK